ncbi:hypothetical protein SDC9_206406 [bioreactor metagenome]|uniref:Uncharacterized protein n=1 Tax=bioreactor metagenome TaxID=1076179 RepID=A0A645J4R6_9ZZZZ
MAVHDLVDGVVGQVLARGVPAHYHGLRQAGIAHFLQKAVLRE